MRIYFLSAQPAALKLDGQYAGTIDLFERYAEIDMRRGALAEIIPHDNSLPVNFFIDEKFFECGHPFADAYILGDERLIYLKNFARKGGEIEVIAQGEAGGGLLTIFEFGGIYACFEGRELCGGGAGLVKLAKNFARAEVREIVVGGRAFAAAVAEGALSVFDCGRQVFLGEGNFEYGDALAVLREEKSCADIVTEGRYIFDGQAFVPERLTARERRAVPEKMAHFALFEGVMYGCDCTKYLSDELSPRAGELNEYLGNFLGVVPPTELFCERHKDIANNCAGLIYRRAEGLFEVKYFAVQFSDGRADNIYPTD